jgi:hypothetical protein
MGQIRTLSGIQEIERVPLAKRQLAPSTYAMIRQSALTSPDRPAQVFFRPQWQRVELPLCQ